MRKGRDVQKEIKDSAHKIWLAGLGALAVAGEEGKTLFRTLVEKGEEFEAKGRDEVEKVADKVRDRVGDRVSDAKSSMGELWDKVQDGLDDRVAKTLERLGVPTRKEIATLTKRVEELAKGIEKAKRTAPAAATPKRAAAPQPETK